MAAYGRDDFVYDDCFSDSDDSLDNFEEDDSEEPPYCSCGQANDQEMIMCEAAKCSGSIWYHYQCAGIDSSKIPENAWICTACVDDSHNLGSYFHFSFHILM